MSAEPESLSDSLAQETIQIEAGKAAAALLTALTAWKKEWPGSNINEGLADTVAILAMIARGE